jgi:glycosyltransferase involved in cell wall biosynthesis
LPLYLPPLADAGEAPEATPVFFGGINVYLQQKWALFRRAPRWVDRLLNARPLLRWASRKSDMTSAHDLGPATLSMLRGEHGRQVKELDKLVEFLAAGEPPDAVSLSNALLAGLARRIREALGVPLVCWLQDEDAFLDGLGEAHAAESWRTLAERARDIDAFLATSRYYADVMTRRLALPAERVHVVPIGIDPADYHPPDAPPQTPTVGFLSKLCEDKGLDTLVEAFIALKRRPGLEAARLKLTGGKSAAERPLLDSLAGRLADAGLDGDVEFQESFDRPERIGFLRSLSALSVPTRQGEAFGLYVVEALACGVPVVVPDHGAFPELVAATGGGLLCRPNDPQALADALAELLTDPARAGEMGRAGRRAVLDRFTARRAADDFVEVCARAAAAPSTPRGDRHG